MAGRVDMEVSARRAQEKDYCGIDDLNMVLG